jgi:hypothetical protein
MGSGSCSSLEPPGRRRTRKTKQARMRQHSSAVPGLDPGTHAQAEHRSSILIRIFIRFDGLPGHPRSSRGRAPGNDNEVMDTENESNQADRTISTGKLHALPHFHTRPINVVVFHGSQGNARFEVGFPLRCFQRLSRPYIAMQHCRWRDNCSTRGTFIPVLSY